MPKKALLYQSIADSLRREILSRRLPPHSRLPSEPELVRRYRAARETVRRALARLEQDGLIYRRPAVGSFVAEPRVDQDLDRLFSFTEFMAHRGIKPGSKLLESGVLRISDPDSPVLRHLRLPVGARVVFLRRLRTGSGEPLVIASTWLPEERFPHFLEQDLRRHSVYEIMGRMGYKPTDAVQTIEAVALGARQAALLGVAPGAAALLIRRVGYAAGGLPVEYAEDFYRGDRTTFRVRLGVLEGRFSGPPLEVEPEAE